MNEVLMESGCPLRDAMQKDAKAKRTFEMVMSSIGTYDDLREFLQDLKNAHNADMALEKATAYDDGYTASEIQYADAKRRIAELESNGNKAKDACNEIAVCYQKRIAELEAQVQKVVKPIFWNDGAWHGFICPECDVDVVRSTPKCQCGAKINWSEAQS